MDASVTSVTRGGGDLSENEHISVTRDGSDLSENDHISVTRGGGDLSENEHISVTRDGGECLCSTIHCAAEIFDVLDLSVIVLCGTNIVLN